MPPKFVNQKAAAANERKATAAASKSAEAARIAEEEKWKITDPKELKMLEKRKAEQDKKDAEIKKREEKKALVDEDEARFTSNKAVKTNALGPGIKAPPKKLTQAEITARLIQAKKDLEAQEKRDLDFAEQIHVLEDDELPVNLNHLARDEAARAADEGQDYVTASGIDAAIGAMSISGGADRHPEKRMKAAYTAYEEEWMERLKGEGLKRSQLKEKIFKQWQKAPENPLNQKQ